MRLYRLGISPGENDGEGEDFDEWFTSARAAGVETLEACMEYVEQRELGGDR